MRLSTILKCAAATAVFAMSQAAHAGLVTDTMTNVVTVDDACDVAAIGVDFGVLNSVLSSAVTTYTANSDSKTTVSLPSTGLAALDAAITTAIGTLSGISAATTGLTGAAGMSAGTPGVYAVCATTPSSIVLTSPNATSLSLLTASTLDFTHGVKTFSSKMTGAGGAYVTYNLALMNFQSSTATGLLTGLGLPINVFGGAFLVVPGSGGTLTGIPVQTLPAAGVYTDTVTATVNF